MVKFYKIREVEINEQKIKDHEPIKVEVQTEYGHILILNLVLKSTNKNGNQNMIHLSFEFPLSHPLHDYAYIFGYYDLKHREGRLRVYHQ